ncbi:neuroligin-4, X-linked [Aplysia californica]|uniref:Carboxylic ester hydrolase n=1 Tax=Aplysia californica TaxID=6500 RepID=A0ABM0K1B1_APLCA|nr:neuroligin-4, X-linked [Aplysia californica]
MEFEEKFLRLFVIFSTLPFLLHAQPTLISQDVDPSNSNYTAVTTGVGTFRGRRFNVHSDTSVDIFLGIRYGKAPTGERRFARPEAFGAVEGARNAIVHGAKCVQRIIQGDPLLEGVPFSEDCLFLDIYTPWSANQSDNTPKSVMMFLHGGGYYGGTGALYNFTNVALYDVVVVSVSFRLDIFGFLSSGDDVIPGNFGLLDIALALDWIKDNIGPFGGNPDDITVFGASSGASSASILYLSPLTRGKFQKAIMQSGVANCPWSVHPVNNMAFDPERISKELGQRANCSMRSGPAFSSDLLTCLRQMDVDELVNASVALQVESYGGNMVWLPVVETTFGVLPDTPIKLLNDKQNLMHIPTIYGYTKEDSSWLVPDPENDGVTLIEFNTILRSIIANLFDSDSRIQNELYKNVLKVYLPGETSKTKTPEELRDILVNVLTDGFMTGCIIQEARLFGRPKEGIIAQANSYVYEFAHRPSYSPYPNWWGVAHADEKGFVLGLPVGPQPFMYPNHNASDAEVANHVNTLWTNFAKFGNPTPEPLDGVTWPQFGPGADQEKILLIKEDLEVTNFDRHEQVKVWTELFSVSSGYLARADVRMLFITLSILSVTVKCLLNL